VKVLVGQGKRKNKEVKVHETKSKFAVTAAILLHSLIFWEQGC